MCVWQIQPAGVVKKAENKSRVYRYTITAYNRPPIMIQFLFNSSTAAAALNVFDIVESCGVEGI